MGLGSAINTARETVHNLPTSPEAIKSGALNLCHSAVDACKGSGSVTIEVSDLAKRVASAPLNLVANSLTVCKDIVSLHPVDAVCDAMKGVGAACADVASIVTKPVPIAAAIVGQGLKGAVTIAKAPVTVPWAVGRTVANGVAKVSDLLTDVSNPKGGQSSIPSDAESPAATTSAAPPAA